MFEVGYLIYDGGVQADIEVLGSSCDHICMKWILSTDKYDINLDIMDDGRVRVFSHAAELEWDWDSCLSSMTIQVVEGTLRNA